MSMHVGGRMETVAPIRVTDGSDRARLIALVLISLLLHAWLIGNSAMTARDSLGFAQLAMNLAFPKHGKPELIPGNAASEAIPRTLPQVLKVAKQPPAYPATIYATFVVLKRIDPPEDRSKVSPDQLLFAAQMAAATAMILAVFPMYWLGRMLLGKSRGFAAVLIFQFLPVAARDTSDGLSEGLYFFCLSSALALGVAGIRKQSIGRFLFCGLASGMTYLVRPEGLAVALGGLAVLLGLAAFRLRPTGNMMACAAALIAGTCLSAAPYMVMIGGVTNKPSGKNVIDGTPPSGSIRPGLGAIRMDAPLFAEINVETNRGGPLEKATAAAGTMAREYLHASHYAVGILGIVGLFLIRKRLKESPEWFLLLATAAIQLLALARVAYSQGYASERHLLTASFVAVYFTVGGLEPLFAWFAKWPVVGPLYRKPWIESVWVAVLIAICIPSLLKPLHQNRIGFKKAGEFLATELKPEDKLLDPYEWSQYYAGRTMYWIPNYDYKPVEYAVLRTGGDSEDKRLNQGVVDHVKKIVADPRAKVVYRWPEGPPEEAKIVIYRRDHRDPLPGK